MRVLVTGGAGYIGSFMVKRLLDGGYDVTAVDSLEEGYRDSVDPKAEFIQGNLLDKEFVLKVFKENAFDGVMHFAAYISMKESMENPGKYFQNNVQAAVNVLDAMSVSQCKAFIFSSTAGVYGNPTIVPIPEDHPKNPTNPYGHSKYLVEQILPWYKEIFGIGSVALRYFNAAGASSDGQLGEQHRNETHIIPNIIKSVLLKLKFPLYGTDYDTPDGTCVRDYIHVLDLAEAHILGFEKLMKSNADVSIYNVGTGNGFSNKQIIEAVERVSGKKVLVEERGRRPGDAGTLVANVSKIQKELGFHAMHSDLETIVRTAWKWHEKKWATL